MRIKSKFSIPAALALFVVTAHPEGKTTTTTTSTSSTASQQSELTQAQRNHQSTFDPQRVSDTELKKQVTDLNKASTFTKMSVQNLQNEKLGTVNDLVFDPETGKISYAVLSVGGFLGVGDKLVAVPLTSLRAQPGQNYLVLDMTKEQLNSAPGLAKNSWPNLNDPSLGAPASSEHSSASSSDSSADKSSDKSSTDHPSSQKTINKLSSDEWTEPPKSANGSKDAQGSSPSTTSSSGSSADQSKSSSKDSNATDPSSSQQPSSSKSSLPKA